MNISEIQAIFFGPIRHGTDDIKSGSNSSDVNILYRTFVCPFRAKPGGNWKRLVAHMGALRIEQVLIAGRVAVPHRIGLKFPKYLEWSNG